MKNLAHPRPTSPYGEEYNMINNVSALCVLVPCDQGQTLHVK